MRLMRCRCDRDYATTDELVLHALEMLHRLETAMTESLSNQQHLDQDVQAIGSNVAEIIADLKAQATAAGASLDFTAADALVASTTAEAIADAPPAPADNDSAAAQSDAAASDAPAPTA